MTASIARPWREHGEFEEIDDGRVSETSEDTHHSRIATIGNSVPISGGRGEQGRRGRRDSWQEDKRSNNSDLELIHLKGPFKE